MSLTPIFAAIVVLLSIGLGGLALAFWPERAGCARPAENGNVEAAEPSGDEGFTSPRRTRAAQPSVWM